MKKIKVILYAGLYIILTLLLSSFASAGSTQLTITNFNCDNSGLQISGAFPSNVPSGQSFNITESKEDVNITYLVKKGGAGAGTLSLVIYNQSGGDTSSMVFWKESETTYTAGDIATGGTQLNFSLGTLTVGRYVAGLNASAGAGEDTYYLCRNASSDQYENGSVWKDLDGTIAQVDGNNDADFALYGNSIITSLANPSWVYPSVDDQTNNTNITINISHSGTDVNFSLYVNNQSYFYNVSPTVVGSHFQWLSNFSDGTYVLKASVYNYSGDQWSSNITRTLIIDTVTPTITRLTNNNWKTDNSTVISPYTSNLTINISFYDETDLYQTLINITNSTGDSVYNYTNLTITEFTDNVSETIDISSWAIGNYTIQLVATDSHTLSSIKDYDVVNGLNYFRYKTEEGNVIRIESDTIPLIKRTTKLRDRYTFEFDYLLLKSTYKFKVTSYNKIDYLPSSKYPAHFVIMGNNLRGNWIDFGGINKKDIIVSKIDDYTYEIEITSNGKTNFIFDSLGGLNTKEEHYLLKLGSAIDIRVGDDDTGNGINATAIIGTQFAHTIVYNQSNVTLARLINITKETTSVTLNASGYVTEVKTISLTDNYHNLSFNLTPSSTVKVYFYDEESNSLISGETMSVYLETTGFSSTYGGINSTSDNPYTITGLGSGLYELEASSSNYPERQYFDLNVSNTTTTNLNSYLINTTLGEERTFLVKDSDSDAIEDVRINFTRVINGTRTLVAQEDTDFAGACKLYLDTNYEYRIIFKKSGYNTKTINLEPSDSSYTIYLDDSTIVTPPLAESYRIRKIDYNLTFTNSTLTVLLEWNDLNNYADELCLQIIDLNETYYSNCSTASSNLMTYVVTDDNNTYMAKAYAKKNNRKYVLKTIPINLLKVALKLGKDILIIDWIVFIVLGFMGLANPIAAIVIGTMSLTGMYLVGMLPVGFSTIMGIIFVSIIISISIARAKKI